MDAAIIVFPDIPGEPVQLPLGVCKIATHCNAYFDIFVLDQRIEKDVYGRIKEIATNRNILCVGLSVMTGKQIESAVNLSKHLSGNYPVVWGGVHATMLPEQTINEGYVDYVIVGEGEQAFLELLFKLSESHPDGKASYTSKVRRSYEFNCFSGFEDSSQIDYSLIPGVSSYVTARDGFSRALPIETSRGCPFACGFCHNSAFRRSYRRVRTRTVCSDLAIMKSSFDLDGVVFQEDNLFVQKGAVLDVLDCLKNCGLRWKANARIDVFAKFANDHKFLRELVSSGCQLLQFGIESGSDRVLDLINKRIRAEDAIALNQRLKGLPLRIRYNFMVGFPTETKMEMEKTLALMERLMGDNSNVEPPFLNVYTPYPGTPIYGMAIEKGFVEPTSTEGWASLSWNETTSPWVPAPLRAKIIDMSRKMYEDSGYMKG
ncbi:B12-binding domain-containing radical SAM protein [Ectothiorhodospira variabilis]|uniref:B12-binding domain-containing radical SAM protein n=1 Tax=Ectothiorhodospira variabilis TaxID=505694 RepID=UPI001EFB2A19|nr:radical SAM protein [Ectothiorhodospira variabilis]MCG5493251.1 B12-binding domain-containing radical SAM protein [Ectothiorhodospira variabilis]MCG5502580.1 B12-binding domain-containing radical SAM protein [Ectothiorhodospira variabilis]MCG5505654.1 B12-binding domain-containing radical SAM protein [Ectothiorhodospira variabilis]